VSGGLVLTATALAGMLLGCTVVGGVSQVALARAGADTAADLTALAVAGRLVRGEPHSAACGVGAQVADASGATVVGCSVTGAEASVQVTVSVLGLGLEATVTARSRAGPLRP